MMNVENKAMPLSVALLVAAVLVGLLAWPAGAPPGGEVGPGWSGAGWSFWEGSSFCRQARLIHLARGPPSARFRMNAVQKQAQGPHFGADKVQIRSWASGLGQRKLLRKKFPILRKNLHTTRTNRK